MPDGSTLGLFAVAALALLVVPGPAVLYIVTRSIDQGRRAGLVSILGIHAGTLVHIAATALGLSAVLMRSATAFSAVKYAGAAYLMLLGLRRLLGRDGGDIIQAPRAPAGLWRIFRQGVIVNVLNPKTALFFLAFLPQFTDRSRGAVWAQMLVLGAVFVGLGILSDGTYALLSSWAGARIRDRRGFATSTRYASGTVYLGLGMASAVARSR